MADGAYERRQGREAELKRFARILAGMKAGEKPELSDQREKLLPDLFVRSERTEHG